MKHPGFVFKLIKPTLLFYAVAAIVIYVLEQVSPSGPCTPGLGILSFFLLLIIILILLLRNIYLAIKVDKQNIVIVVLHIIAILLLTVIIQ